MRRQGIKRTSHFTPKSVVGKIEALWQEVKTQKNPAKNERDQMIFRTVRVYGSSV